ITDPVNVTSEGWYDVPSVEGSGTVYRLWTGGATGSRYFLVENRRPAGYDTALPGHGILIWHVDDSVNSNDNQWYPGYTSYGHYHVALEQADGLWQMEQAQNYGDLNDPFPGSSSLNADTFDYWTVPDSRDYSFQDTYVAVSSIPGSADTVSVFFSVDQTGIQGQGAIEGPDILRLASNPVTESASFILSHDGGRASIEIYDITGRVLSTLTDGELPRGRHSFSWSPDDASPGVYFARYSGGVAFTNVRFVLLD
ncbi:MAG: T9SS type A sorting domain-containing protein, partial [Candidatus Fermentibacteraceae bacterium]|nr:T9SS type A sorting domain-containing protein [Candidatus Fermentibacteraceae bacterium]